MEKKPDTKMIGRPVKIHQYVELRDYERLRDALERIAGMPPS